MFAYKTYLRSQSKSKRLLSKTNKRPRRRDECKKFGSRKNIRRRGKESCKHIVDHKYINFKDRKATHFCINIDFQFYEKLNLWLFDESGHRICLPKQFSSSNNIVCDAYTASFCFLLLLETSVRSMLSICNMCSVFHLQKKICHCVTSVSCRYIHPKHVLEKFFSSKKSPDATE